MGRERKYLALRRGAHSAERGERGMGFPKKPKETRSLECGEWQEIRVATHAGDNQSNPVRIWKGGTGRRAVPGLTTLRKSTNPDPQTSRGGNKIKKKDFSPMSRKTYWKFDHRPYTPLLLFPPAFA